MEWSKDQHRNETGRPGVDSSSGVIRLRRTPSSTETPAETAIDLVYQAAEVLQGIENRAVETTTRAHDLARQATEQLQMAESRIRALQSAQSAAEAALQEANNRADQAEQAVKTTEAQIADMANRVAAAEQRARNAETRAIEAEKTLIRIEDAIRSQLLARRSSAMNRSMAA